MTATADPTVPSDGDDNGGEEMTLFEHLGELRTRLFRAALGFAAFFVVGFIFNGPIGDVLTAPYCAVPVEVRGGLGDGTGQCQLIFTEVLGAFVVRIKAAMVVAVTFGGPIIAYQIWAFIVPGLKSKEKKYAAPFVLLSQLLFLAGAGFSLLIIPAGLEFLLNFAGDFAVPLLDANNYLSFLIRTMVGFGLAFQYPLIIAALVLMNLVTREWLTRYRRHFFFGSFVAAAIITPSQDPFTMCVMALPLALFYEICILFARFVERARAKVAGGTAA